jgi:hypothetical protein
MGFENSNSKRLGPTRELVSDQGTRGVGSGSNWGSRDGPQAPFCRWPRMSTTRFWKSTPDWQRLPRTDSC